MSTDEKITPIRIGDLVWCTESGVRGTVLRFYKPTACEEQAMVETDDGRGQYHAPVSWWKLYQPNNSYLEHQDRSGMSFADNPLTGDSGEMLNEHGKYVTTFARNHGISIAEAHEAPMVKAHLAYFQNAVSKNFGVPQQYFRSATD